MRWLGRIDEGLVLETGAPVMLRSAKGPGL